MTTLFFSRSVASQKIRRSGYPRRAKVSFGRQERLNNQKGAISIYLALLLIFVMTTGALVLNQTLVKQIKIANTITSSEKAYYAATSGLEEGLFKAKLLAHEAGEVNQQQNIAADIAGDVSNNGQEPTYKARAGLYRSEIAGKRVDELCAVSVGMYRQASRRVIVTSANCNFD